MYGVRRVLTPSPWLPVGVGVSNHTGLRVCVHCASALPLPFPPFPLFFLVALFHCSLLAGRGSDDVINHQSINPSIHHDAICNPNGHVATGNHHDQAGLNGSLITSPLSRMGIA